MRLMFRKLRTTLVGAAAVAAAESNLIDPVKDESGSITLSKCSTDFETSVQQNGKPSADPVTNVLKDATFELHKVTVPNCVMSTNGGWQDLQDFIDTSCAHPSKTVFGVAAHLVRVADQNDDASPVTPDNLDARMCDVYLYPKNLVGKITKTLLDTDIPKEGDLLKNLNRWKITAKAPRAADNNVKILKITHKLVLGLTYQPGDRSLTVSGLWGQDATFKIDTKVNDKDNGVIENEAIAITNRPGNENEVEVATSKIESKYGKACWTWPTNTNRTYRMALSAIPTA